MALLIRAFPLPMMHRRHISAKEYITMKEHEVVGDGCIREHSFHEHGLQGNNEMRDH